MIIFLIGTPGSGKGTQSELVAKKLNLSHVSGGEIFRNEMENNKQLRKILKEGSLVPDEIVTQTLKNYLKQNNIQDDLLLDGSPRSLNQYQLFKEYLDSIGKKIDKVVYLKISDNEAVRRLSARRCHKDGTIYNLITNPPPDEVNEEDLVQREDDKPEAIKQRLKVQKVPDELLDQIRKDGILIEVDGERPIGVIAEDILQKLGEKNA